MHNTATALPSVITAGDTLSFRRQFSEYVPSAGWALTYTLIGPAGLASFAASPDGDAWQITVAAATTAGFPTGVCSLLETAEQTGVRHTLGRRTVQVRANLAAATAGTDTRSHARRMLESIEAWLEKRAPTMASMQIAGRRLDNYPLPDLLALRDRYREEVRREDAAQSGGRRGRLLVRI